MAIIAEFTNSVALAAEIEARTAALQAIKEGRFPIFAEEQPVTPAAVVTPTLPSVTVPATPVVPTV